MKFKTIKNTFIVLPLLLIFLCSSANAQQPHICSYTSQTATDFPKLNWGDGVNVQPSYKNGGNVWCGWALMKNFSKIRTVRIEIEPGVPLTYVKRWISNANRDGYNVICTYHKFNALASGDREELLKAARWWKANYWELRNASGPFTVNLMNEWGGHDVGPWYYAQSYNEAIKIVREVYSGRIIIDLPGYGQGTRVATIAEPFINDENIVFSIHVYREAAVVFCGSQEKDKGMRRWHLDELERTNRPIIIGEFGDSGKPGYTNWHDIVNYAKSKGWPIIGWAWSGDDSPTKKMNMTKPVFPGTPTGTTDYFNVIYDKLRWQPSGKEEFVDTPDFDISPNPANDFLNITFENVLEEKGSIEIFDMMGKTVMQQSIEAQSNNLRMSIDELPRGTYGIKLQSGDIHAAKIFIKAK